MVSDNDLTRGGETPAADVPLAEPQLGPYRLIRELGSGGMGTVFLAVRSDDAFQKRVAIKVLRRGMDTDAIVRRFRHERQILASLQHPYIAGLLDGGTTGGGLPFFAMEYVEGEPLTEFCDARRLDTSARLDLFRKVCAAVQYAHQNLIIHRDIKPANVLVTRDGTPKLLDFGIAKLLNPEMGGQTLAPTAAGLHLMTPEYASPEQVRGENVTTTSDIYALGVLLYELLTGRRPYRLTSRAPADVARVVCHEVPLAPSTVVTDSGDAGAGTRTGDRTSTTDVPTGAHAERLRRRLAGDLDTIVLKALSKDPERRYVSVDQFSEDIRRHLAGLPVMARRDTIGYRVAKFVQRNRGAVAASAAAAVALVAALAITAWQASVAARERQRAEQRFEDVRQLANASLFELHDAIRDLPGSTPARQLLVTRGLEYLDKLAQDGAPSSDLQREIAHGYLRVADVQGRRLNPNLGDTAGALASYQKSLALFEAVHAASPGHAGAARDLATAETRMSEILTATGDTAGALAHARRSLTLLQGLSGPLAATPDVRRELAVAHSVVGDMLSATGETRAAIDERRAALGIMEALRAAEGDSLANLRQLGVAYQKLANSLGNPNHPNIGDYAGAWDYLQRSGEVFRRAATLFPTNAVFARNAAVIDSNSADVLVALERRDEALMHQRRASAGFQALVAADPANVFARNDVAISAFKIGEMLSARGDLDGAVREYQRSLGIHQEMAAADPQNATLKAEVASGSSGLAMAEAKLGRRAAALTNHARAVSISRELRAANPDNVELQVAEALSILARGMSFLDLHDRPAARRDYEEAVRLLDALERQGVIEGTDLKTLTDARAKLAELR